MNTKSDFSLSKQFELVCQFLGNGWRVNKNIEYAPNHICLISPELKGFHIYAKTKGDRINIHGYISSRLYRGRYFQCTAKKGKKPASIASDIKKKILCHAADEVANLNNEISDSMMKNQHREVILGLLSKLVEVCPDSNHRKCGFIHKNVVRGNVNLSSHDRYSVNLENLDTDSLIKIIGFISTLEKKGM